MPEAELRIRPRMVGNAGQSLSQTRSSIRSLGRSQKKMARQGRRSVSRLESAYNSVRRGVGRVKRGLRGVVNRVFSLQSAIVGTVAFGAGRTFLEATLGSADEMDRAQKQMGEIFDDANAAMARSRELTGEVASLSMGDAVQGMQSLGVMADGSADKAGELVKLGKALEQIRPEQGFQGASLALKELASGQTRSLVQRFDMPREVFPDRSEAKRIAKKQGKTLQGVYLDTLRGFIEEERGGVERLLQIDRESLSGNLQMLKTAGRDLLREVGEQALPEVTESVQTAAEELRSLRDDPEFQEAARQFGEMMGDAAESVADMAPKLIRGIPKAVKTVTDAIQTAKDFYDAHPTLVKVAAGMFAANSVTGGGLTKLGGKLLGLGGSGDGKCCEGIGDAADSLGDVASNATSAGSRGFLQKALFRGGSTAAAASFTEGTLAAITPSVVGPLAAAAVPVAVGAMGLKSFANAKRGPTETSERAISSESQVSNALLKDLVKGRGGAAKRSIIEAAGGKPGETFTGRRDQQELLESVNTRLESFGLRADLKKGQKFKDISFKQAGGVGHELGTLFGAADTELSDISDMTASRAVETLNSTGVKVEGGINVDVGATSNPEEAGKKAKDGVKQAMDEQVRKERARR